MMKITLLLRKGGWDTSAVAVSLNAKECQIYTDVDGYLQPIQIFTIKLGNLII